MENNSENTLGTIRNNDIYEFIEEVIQGIEMKLYNQLNEENKLDIIKNSEIMYMGINYLEIYLNIINKSLLEKTDPLICQKIDKISNIYSLENKYILNIITNMLMKSYPKFTRSKLNPESKEAYLNSVNEILKLMRKYIEYIFESDMNKLMQAFNKTDC
jgi:hypothetical protein